MNFPTAFRLKIISFLFVTESCYFTFKKVLAHLLGTWIIHDYWLL